MVSIIEEEKRGEKNDEPFYDPDLNPFYISGLFGNQSFQLKRLQPSDISITIDQKKIEDLMKRE